MMSGARGFRNTRCRTSGSVAWTIRREALLHDAPPVAGREIGERDEVPIQEGVAIIIVLDVKGAAHSLRRLEHETENAEVVAPPDVDVKGRMRKG